ncbi:MAG: cupin domain-containing protein [Bryobacteraceae bacterium]
MKLMAIVCAFPLIAAAPPGFVYWSSAELKGMAHTLAAKADGAKFASEPLGKFGNHLTMIARRGANGQAELHETDADLFVVQTGSATLVVGGKIPNAKTSAPHEVRGTSIEGGTKRTLGPGDIVHIPARTPHQLQVQDGKEFTYFVLKVSGQ